MDISQITQDKTYGFQRFPYLCGSHRRNYLYVNDLCNLYNGHFSRIALDRGAVFRSARL